MSGRPVMALLAEPDLDETVRRITDACPWVAFLWRLDLAHDPHPPFQCPGARVLRITYREPPGPCHLVRPGDALTLDPEDASWRSLRHWPLGDRDDSTNALHGEALAGLMEGRLEEAS